MTAQYSGTDNLEVMAEAKNYNRYLTLLVRRELRPHEKLLDFGAGVGTFALPLQQLGIDILCVEPDDALRTGLRQAGAQAVSSLTDVPDETIDLAYTFNVLEHIVDDRLAVRGLASKLKRGGRLLVYVPAFEVLFSAMDRKVGHHRRYRRRQLVELLMEAGLQLQSASYADSLGFLAALAYKVLGSDSGEINRRALKTYDAWVFPLSRALDSVARRWVGKNLMAIATKP